MPNETTRSRAPMFGSDLRNYSLSTLYICRKVRCAHGSQLYPIVDANLRSFWSTHPMQDPSCRVYLWDFTKRKVCSTPNMMPYQVCQCLITFVEWCPHDCARIYLSSLLQGLVRRRCQWWMSYARRWCWMRFPSVWRWARDLTGCLCSAV